MTTTHNTPDSNEALLPCPFCGNANVDVSNGYDEDANWVVICRSCKSSGTFCAEKAAAITRWNSRASVAAECRDPECWLRTAKPAAASSPAPAEPPKSLLRDPIQVRVLPPPIVTRDGVPCEDQPAALEEFKQRCRASLDDKEAGCVHGVPVCEECAATPSPSETAVGREARTCSDCGHGFGVDLRGRCRTVLRDAGGSLVNCGCKCRLAAAPVPVAIDDEGKYQAGVLDACKAICECCANTEKWGDAARVQGSTRFWHGDYPCNATPIRTMLAAALRSGEGS